MTDVKKTLQTWSLAGKAEWSKTFKLIQKLRIETRNPTLREYLITLQSIIIKAGELAPFVSSDVSKKGKFSLAKLQNMQKAYYADLAPELTYNKSFGNPSYAKDCFGAELGKLLCLAYARFRDYLTLIIMQRYTTLAQLNQLFLDLVKLSEGYSKTKQNLPKWEKAIRQYMLKEINQRHLFSIYWRYSPQQDYYKNIILKADLADLSYLYRYGTYISKHVLDMAKFMAKYPEKDMQMLSRYIVKCYVDGFVRGNRSYKIKKYAMLIIPAGMERLGRLVIKELKKLGLDAVVQQPLTESYNKQYDYDHRFNMSVYYDQAYVDKMLPAHKKAVEAMSKVFKLHAGPVYVELFGEVPFTPKDNPAAFKLSGEQMQLLRLTSGKTSQIFYQHYKREESSFCIIAFPSPEIGGKFRQIFADTVKVNMLDSMRYAAIQQKIIDVLDKAEYVHVKGKGANQTDIKVKLHTLKNPKKETNFENCVADVNIPVGEVFTSPLLKGTNGTLHVKDIYLSNLRFHNLKITFKDGYISDYDCTNFKSKAANKKFIEENLLMPHKTLPIGEFAIGTNTAAYQMALKYDILSLLPILIIEKMGPHFAVGDTCYTREEDVDHFNFYDGKKIIAVENEKTALRKKDPMNAYTQVHTDITLPYEMLKSITAIRKDGATAHIIQDGMFVVPGTEELNIPLKKLKGKK